MCFFPSRINVSWVSDFFLTIQSISIQTSTILVLGCVRAIEAHRMTPQTHTHTATHGWIYFPQISSIIFIANVINLPFDLSTNQVILVFVDLFSGDHSLNLNCVCAGFGFFPFCKLPIEMQLSKTNDVCGRACVCHRIFYILFWFGLSIQTHGRLNLRFFAFLILSHFTLNWSVVDVFSSLSFIFFPVVWITIISRYAFFYHGFWWTVGILVSFAPIYNERNEIETNEKQTDIQC